MTMKKWWPLVLLGALGCSGGDDARSFSPSIGPSSPGPSTPSGGGDDGYPSTASVLDDLQAELGWGPSRCTEAPAGEATGYDTGDQIPRDLVFRDESGAPVQLAELCGAKAVWLYFAHTWCPPCLAAGEMAEELATRYADDEIAVVQIVVADEDDKVPDAEDCRGWRRNHGQVQALTLYDAVESYLDLELADATSLSVILDENQVISTKFHGTDRQAFIDAIDEAAGL